MGSELSCPCGSKNQLETEESPNKKETDIIEEIMKGKLLPQNITFEHTYKQTKICLIKTEELEGFFANRNILKLVIKKEINYYYNLVFITNFMAINNILLQYTPGMEDKTFMRSATYLNNKNKKRNSASVDYSTNYKIEKLNLVSIEKKKVIEQILIDLSMNVKKDYLFYGIVNDSDERVENNYKTTSSLQRVAAPRNFKLLYKRSLLRENIDVKYTIHHYEGTLDKDIILDFVKDPANKYKALKAIMTDSALDDNILKKNYYFIFEESKNAPVNGYDNLVIELEQGNNSNKMLIQDMAVKLNDFQVTFKLCCIVCDEKKIYVVLHADVDELHSEAPFDLETPNLD
jgi:hypothetical protein